jgi:DNA-binding IclR family transcriptional regulator
VEQDFHAGDGASGAQAWRAVVVSGPAPGTQSIDRAGEMLARLLESDEPMSLRELAEAADLPKSTASRLLTALERHGLVHQAGQRGKLEPGPAILRFAQRGGVERHLVELAEIALEAVSESSGETVNLSVPTPYGVDHLAQVDGRHFLGAGQWVGRRVDYHCTANGKVFLAFGAAELPPGRLARLTTDTVVSRATLDDELARVRRDGYATAVDELEAGLTAIAAPVHGPSGDVIAALSISGPTLRLTRERVAELAPVLVQEARALAERLVNRSPGERAA